MNVPGPMIRYAHACLIDHCRLNSIAHELVIARAKMLLP